MAFKMPYFLHRGLFCVDYVVRKVSTKRLYAGLDHNLLSLRYKVIVRLSAVSDSADY